MPGSNPRSIYENPDNPRESKTAHESEDESDIISIPPPPGELKRNSIQKLFYQLLRTEFSESPQENYSQDSSVYDVKQGDGALYRMAKVSVIELEHNR